MINPNMICMRCMSQLNTENGICPSCGFDNASCQNEPHQLECRSILAGAYLLGCVIGQGGFGITYTGWDLNLDIKIAIKEYYPLGFAARDANTHISVLTLTGDKREFFQKGMERFVNEAKTLARLRQETGIVGVRGFFYENGTAYIVMDFVEGETLKSLASRRGGKLPAQEVLKLFRPLCDSLSRVHAAGLLHRDISPDNIILRPDGQLTLVDFGAARQISAYGEHSNTINVKHGFAPEEQYRTHGEQGPWTDIYALCATIYRLITGQTPPQALDRLSSGAAIESPRKLGADLTPAQENALLHGLGISAQYRIRDMQALVKELYAQTAANSATDAVSQQSVKPNVSPFGTKPEAGNPVKPRMAGDKKKTIALIAGSALGIYLLIVLSIGAPRDENTQQQAQTGQFSGISASAGVAGDQKVAATSAPVKRENPVKRALALDFGEQYYCTVADFSETYDISDSDVKWRSADPSLVSCTGIGVVSAGYVQPDITKGYNNAVEVIGTSPDGVEFVYRVVVGNGSAYTFNWSTSARSLKDSIGYTYIASPSIRNCVGFTLDFQYEAIEGSHSSAWVFWVHDVNGEWISFTNLYPQNKETISYDLTFDHVVDIDEIVMQPINDYKTKKFTYYTYYDVRNLIYAD